MRKLAKGLAHLVALSLIAPLLGWRSLSLIFTDGDRTFRALSQALATVPGTTGVLLRREFYRWTLAECGVGCTVSFGTIFSTARARLGDYVYVGAYCTLGYVRIGDDSLLGSNVDITSGKNQHHYDDPTLPIRLQGGEFQEVKVGEDVWIGNGAVVLADVGAHSIIAAGAVVTRAVPEGAIAGGTPAKVLKARPGWDQLEER